MRTQGQVEIREDFDKAIGAWLEAGSGEEPLSFLRQRGVDLPEGATVTVTPIAAAEGDTLDAHTRTCHEVCVDIKLVKYCYEKCKDK